MHTIFWHEKSQKMAVKFQMSPHTNLEIKMNSLYKPIKRWLCETYDNITILILFDLIY